MTIFDVIDNKQLLISPCEKLIIKIPAYFSHGNKCKYIIDKIEYMISKMQFCNFLGYNSNYESICIYIPKALYFNDEYFSCNLFYGNRVIPIDGDKIFVSKTIKNGHLCFKDKDTWIKVRDVDSKDYIIMNEIEVETDDT